MVLIDTILILILLMFLVRLIDNLSRLKLRLPIIVRSGLESTLLDNLLLLNVERDRVPYTGLRQLYVHFSDTLGGIFMEYEGVVSTNL